MSDLIIEARGIARRFGHVQALQGADFSLKRGEVVALIGDNGAGKSTMVRILSGTDQPNEGEIRVNGQFVHFKSPQDARDCGIETVYQDLALCPDLDTSSNVFLGREVLRSGFLGYLGVMNTGRMRDEAAGAMEKLGVNIDLTSEVYTLSGGQRQSVAVARADMWAKNVIFMDEPTAALGVVQTQSVLDLIRRVRDAGKSVVLISHNMPQVLEISDRIIVLRLGRTVAQVSASEVSVDDLIRAMTAGQVRSDKE